MSEAPRGAALRADLKALLVTRLRLRNVDPAGIGDDEPLVRGELGLDSIDMLELALAVEERYRVKITDEQLAQAAFRTIAALAAFVEEQAGGAAGTTTDGPSPPGPAAGRGPGEPEASA